MTKEIIEEFITKSEKLIIKFGAEWCSPCRMMTPILEEVEKTGITVITIDIDKQPELSEEFEINSLPTMIFYKEGKFIDKVVGAVSKNVIESKFK